MDVVFILDFFLNCITAYVDKDQLLVISHFAIAKHYVKTWAIIDLASAIPFDMILEPDSIHISSCTTGNDISPEAPNKLLRAGRVAKVMRLLRLLRLGKLGLAFKKLSMYTDIRWGVIRILQFGTSVLLVCHVLACFWMLVPRLDNFERPSWATTTTIGDTDIKDTNYWTQYIYCLYWAITTMSTIGYGDVTPKNEVETSVCIVAMLVGSAVFAYGITTLCEIVANLSLRDVFYHQQADMMLEMLRYMNIDPKIRGEVRKYMYFKKRSSVPSFFHEDQLLESLSPPLRQKVLTEYNFRILQRFPIFYPKPLVFAVYDLIEKNASQGRRLFTKIEVNSRELAAPVKFPIKDHDSGQLLYLDDIFSHERRFLISRPTAQQLMGIQRLSLLEEIAHRLQGKHYSSDTVILTPEMLVKSCFFIANGTVTEMCAAAKLDEYGAGDTFGEIPCILNRCSPTIFICNSACDVFELDEKDFRHIFSLYPHVWQEVIFSGAAAHIRGLKMRGECRRAIRTIRASLQATSWRQRRMRQGYFANVNYLLQGVQDGSQNLVKTSVGLQMAMERHKEGSGSCDSHTAKVTTKSSWSAKKPKLGAQQLYRAKSMQSPKLANLV